MISRIMILALIWLSTNQVLGSPPSVTLNIPTNLTEYSDAQAIKILNKVYHKYASYSSLSMNIDITIQDGNYSYKKAGKAYVKGNKYRLETTDEDIVSNGSTLWLHLKSDKSLHITDASSDYQNFFCYPATLLQRYQKYCAVEFLPETEKEYILQFISYDDDCPYEKITVYISKSNYNINKIEALESMDIGYTVDIKSVKKNIEINNRKFFFDEKIVKPSKIRDLRTVKK